MNSSNEIYKRKLQGHERRHLYAPNSIIPIVIKIKGNIDKNNLKTAIEKVQERHVLLRSRIEIDNSNTAWYTTEGTDEIPIKIIDRISDEQWITVCKNESKIPFDFHKRPPIRFILLSSKTKSDIILFCHHMFSDGMSVANLANDVLMIIGNPEKKLKNLPPPPVINRENIPSEISDNILVQNIINRINKKWKNEAIIFNRNDYLSIFNAYWKRYSHTIQVIELSEEQTESIVNRCRLEHVTVNSFIFATYLKTEYNVKNYIKPKKQKAGVAVDVRNHLKTPVGDSFGFFAAGFIDNYKFINHIDFWDFTRLIYKKILKKLSKKKFFINLLRAGRLEPSIHDALIVKTYGNLVDQDDERYNKLSLFAQKKNSISSMAKKFGAMHFSFAVTNLGRLDFPRFYGDFELDRMLAFPPTGPTIETTIFVMTVCGKLSVIMSYVEDEVDAKIMKKLREKFEENLLSFK